jgi:hypothetical protein
MVKIVADAVQVRPPGSFLPVFGRRPEGNWYPLYDVKITDDEVSGRWRLNALYKPKLRIDRTSGVVSAWAPYLSFRGSCEPFDPAARKF